MFYEHLRNERAISGKEPLPADKGEYMGSCNRTACLAHPADWYNHWTRHYYCASCARKINDANHSDAMRQLGHELCTKGENPSQSPTGMWKDTPPTNEDYFFTHDHLQMAKAEEFAQSFGEYIAGSYREEMSTRRLHYATTGNFTELLRMWRREPRS